MLMKDHETTFDSNADQNVVKLVRQLFALKEASSKSQMVCLFNFENKHLKQETYSI